MESSINLRKNHKFLSVSGYLKQICQPLEHLHIHLFTYLKNFHDGSQINISTQASWVADYYQLGLYKSSLFEADPTRYATGFKSWPLDSSLQVFQHGREHYDSYYGLTFCQKVHDGCEFYFFSTSSKHYGLLDHFLNNLDLFENFVHYFKDRAMPLLKECSAHRIIIPEHFQQIIEPSITAEVMIPTLNRHAFCQALQSRHDPLAKWLNDYEPLTKKERDCLNLLLEMPTASEIAERLALSKRTVETHLENIKQKLQCKSKVDLIKQLTYWQAHLPKKS